MLNHAARRNQRDSCAMLSSAANERCQKPEPLCVDVIHAREVERHVCWRSLI
jgi:hypothetical protein